MFKGIFRYFGNIWIFLGILGMKLYISILYRYCIDIVSIHIARPCRREGTLTFLTVIDHFVTGTHVFTLLFVISRRTRLLPSWACFFSSSGQQIQFRKLGNDKQKLLTTKKEKCGAKAKKQGCIKFSGFL